MPETRAIVILGASYGGLGAAHYFLKHVYPHLPSDGAVTYKVFLVDPSAKWYQRHASPRAAASAELAPADKMFLDIAPGFKQYGDEFAFMQAKATFWDPEARVVVLQRPDGKEETMEYYALILATGTKTYAPIFSSQGTPHTDIQAALRTLHSRITNARSIVIAGGGPAAVETAGELGELLNRAAGFWSSHSSKPKVKITVFTHSEKLLPSLRPAIAKQAEAFLDRVGVDVRYSTKITSVREALNGKTKITLHDGEELEPDIYIPATGVRPMSDYVPKHLKNEKGYVIMNNETLRVDAAGPRVYAIGDISTYSNNTIIEILSSVPVMETNLMRDLVAAHSDIHATPTGKDRIYKRDTSEMQLVPVGRNKGVGAIYGWRVPSLVIWLIKGGDYMIPGGPKEINGERWAKEVPWKFKEQ